MRYNDAWEARGIPMLYGQGLALSIDSRTGGVRIQTLNYGTGGALARQRDRGERPAVSHIGPGKPECGTSRHRETQEEDDTE